MKPVNRLLESPLSSVVSVIPPRAVHIVKRAFGALRLYDERAVRLGLNEVYSDDTFILSYPKSGNTWVRFLIANMSEPSKTINFRNIDRYVPPLGPQHIQYINCLKSPRFIKVHQPKYETYKRFIYICRDGRDALVSYYHYSAQKGFMGTFSEFLRSPIPRSYGHWHNHVSGAIRYAQKHSDRVLILKYEQMLESPIECTHQIAEFCRLSVPVNTIERAVQACEFHELQRIENLYGSERAGEDMKFFRSGKSEQWRVIFSESDLQYFQSMAETTLRRMGYAE